MIANRMTDCVAICARDRDLAAELAGRLPAGEGWSRHAPHPAWHVATRSLGHGDVPHGVPFVLEGWPDLVRWRGSPAAAHEALRDLAEQRRGAELPGDTGLLHVGADGRGWGVRAAAGRIPLYWHRSGGATILSTRMDLLLQMRPEWPWRPDAVVLHCWIESGLGPAGRTSIRDVGLVPQACSIEIAPGAAPHPPSRHWDPRPDRIPYRSDHREYARRMRAIVLRHLDEELDPGAGNLLALSGGADSSTLAVAAARILGRPYSAISIRPENPIDAGAESEVAGRVAAAAPPQQHVALAVGPEAWVDLMRAAPSAGIPIIHPVLISLRRAPRAATYFGGEWADAVCGEKLTVPDWLAHAPADDVLRHYRSIPIGRRWVAEALGQRLIRRRPIGLQSRLLWRDPWWATDPVRAEYREWLDAARRAERADSRPLAALAGEYRDDYWLLQNWEVCSALGIRRVTPFFNRALLELAFSASPTALLGPGVKKPLREAFATEVPYPLLHRPKDVWSNEEGGRAGAWKEPVPAFLLEVCRSDVIHADVAYGSRLTLAALFGYAAQLDALHCRVKTKESQA